MIVLDLAVQWIQVLFFHLCQPDDVTNAVEMAMDQFKRVNILVNSRCGLIVDTIGIEALKVQIQIVSIVK